MKLKYENYMLDKTAPEYLVATLISLVFIVWIEKNNFGTLIL